MHWWRKQWPGCTGSNAMEVWEALVIIAMAVIFLVAFRLTITRCR